MFVEERETRVAGDAHMFLCVVVCVVVCVLKRERKKDVCVCVGGREGV